MQRLQAKLGLGVQGQADLGLGVQGVLGGFLTTHSKTLFPLSPIAPFKPPLLHRPHQKS